MNAVIIAHGRLRPSVALRELVTAADLVICADGGLRYARALGRAPQVVIGDFDSAPAELAAWARRHGTELLQYPLAKDKTDTELAFDVARARGAREVDFLAVLGGRPDHALANLLLLVSARRYGVRARIHDGPRLLFLVGDQDELPGRTGDTLSLLALSEVVEGIQTAGLRYPLKDGSLPLGSSLGISNVIASVPATVTAQKGLLLAVLIRRSSVVRSDR